MLIIKLKEKREKSMQREKSYFDGGLLQKLDGNFEG